MMPTSPSTRRDQVRRAAAGTLLASFRGSTVPEWVGRAVDDGLGGICVYGSNRGLDVASMAAVLHERRADVVVAADEEGGDVTRLEAATGSSVPGNAALGVVDHVDLTQRIGGALGGLLRSVGIDLDLAPCADVNSDPANPVIGVRSFGADPHLAARHTAAFVSGLQAAGVAACAKHFPGHGAVTVDSHLALPTVDAPLTVLRERELVPFRAALAAGVAAVMPGHLLVPALDADAPATVSRAIITDLLRGELGFDGVVVTDALDMGGIGGPPEIPANVVRALAAGADLCCLGPDNDEALVQACIDAVEAAVAAGTLAAERLWDAATRVAALRPALDVAAGRSDLASVSDACAGEGRQNAGSPSGGTGEGDLASVSGGCAGEGRQNDGAPPDQGTGRDTVIVALARAGAEAAGRALRVDGVVPHPVRGAHVVELDRPVNIAAGAVPWGVAASLAGLDPTTTAARVAEGDDAGIAAALDTGAGRPLVVVVRDPQRRPAQATALRTLLGARPDAVVVDMGWPSAAPTGVAAPGGPGGADDAAGGPGGGELGDPGAPAAAVRITTFGASRASGEAVARLLAGVHETEAGPPAGPTRPTSGRISRG